MIHKEGKVIDYEAGVNIYNKDTLAVEIRNKNWGLPPHVVKMIEIYSPVFHTKEGVRVGMKISELRKLFPGEKAGRSGDDGGWVLCSERYQTKKFLGFGRDITFVIRLSISDKTITGSDGMMLDLGKVKGVVSYIDIYDEN